MLEASVVKVSPLEAQPKLISHETRLKLSYVGDTAPESKLAIGIGHLWSWAGFMAAHIWDINFAVICELHHYSGYNNEPVCPKCSFKLILYNLTWYHVTFL